MPPSIGKKHKKEKKHKHHRSHSSDEEAIQVDDGYDEEHHYHKHKKQKIDTERERRHSGSQRDRQRDRERRAEVIDVVESDSDSSDCVEVPVDTATGTPTLAKNGRSVEKDRDRTPPPPPQLSKGSVERERARGREREKEREKERDRERERERERDRERERERRERDRELERRREREREEARDREIRERERAREQRERERDRDRERERERDRDRNREKERDRYGRNERSQRIEKDRQRDRSRSKSPIPENGAGDVLSIEETNKLRAKLGLKPLEVDSGPAKVTSSSGASVENGAKNTAGDFASYKDEWGEFLHKPADNLKEKAEAEKFRDKLKQRKEKRFLEERLKRIKTLGEEDDEVDDLSKWVERTKKITDAKKEAQLKVKELEELDAEFSVDVAIEKEKDKEQARRKAYTDKHLKGLRVDHDLEEFSEGKTVILTLKDKGVLDDEEEDALINVNMVDNERYRKNVENKKQNPLAYGYNVYEEQYDELGNPIERNILQKYDGEIAGSNKKKNFVIGESIEEQRDKQRKLLEIKTKLAGKRLETLADVEIQLASDTLSESELAKFKKPKKKVKKLRQKLKADDLIPLENEPSELHLGSRNPRQRTIENDDVEMNLDEVKDENIKIEEEDNDLERALAKARKLKQKENIIKKPMPVDVETIKQEIKIESDDGDTELSRNNDGHIVMNSTAEFCRTLGDIPTYGMAGNRNDDSNDMLDFEESNVLDEKSVRKQEEPQSSHGTWNTVDPDQVMRPVDLDDFADEVEEVAILDEEPDVGAGVANALRLALSKGYLEKEEHNRPSNSKMAHLQAKNYSIEDKSAGDDDKFGRRDRYHSGPIMEFKDKDTFKPNVKLEYIDDNGRILNLKEAFRYLSHKFHGKGPGKNKIEKRLKKMEQEGLMKTMSSTDTPLGTLTMLQQKQKETKAPYVVLSGGKQAALGGASISKYK